MKNIKILFNLLFPLMLFSQTQLGGDIDGEAAGDSSRTVSFNDDGTIVAIGASSNDGNGSLSGHVRVYQYSGGSWTQLGGDIDGEAEYDNSGTVSLSGNGIILAVGASSNDGNGSNSGHVRVYQYSGGSWTQLGSDIDGERNGDNSGSAISLSNDGTRVAIGAYSNGYGISNSSRGHVRIYEYSNGSWLQLGSDIDGEAKNNYFGTSVSFSSDGTTVAIGAKYNYGANGGDSGHVRVYQYSGGSWTQLGDDIDGEAEYDQSGTSVSLSSDGSIVAIGAEGNDGNGSNSGHVRVYQYSGGSWTQLGDDINGESSGDRSGSSVSLNGDGTMVAIGAYNNDGNGADSGHVRVYQYSGNSWIQFGADIDGENSGDWSGRYTSISNDGIRVAIGAQNNDGNGADSGHVRVYDFSAPTINSVSMASNNSTITVTTSVGVYNSNGGSSDLEVSDFTLSISGGNATLTSSTPTSITKTSQSIWVLGVGLAGTPTGEETLTVTPVANSIYAGGVVMSTTQTGNSASVNNIAPTFNAVRLSLDNSYVEITASEQLFTSTGGSGELIAEDFTFSISGGTATLSSTTPTSISTNGLVTTLGIGLSGTPDGNEILKLNPTNSTAIYDSGNIALSKTNISVGVKLFPNTISMTSLTISGETTAGALTVDSVIIDGNTIGHSSDVDLMTFASGSLTVAGDIVVSSDARLKTNIVALGPTLMSLLQIEAKSYTMKDDTEQKQKIGLLAQEVQKVFPELVSEDKNGMLAVNYQALVPVLINALKEQEDNYNQLVQSIEMLEKEILNNK
jgi:hypothetical protein